LSFSIKAIVVYSRSGVVRPISLRENGLNVITGRSKTGKSAIIDIIDYCLGRGSFNVAEGTIRQKSAWFALHLVKGNDAVFVARNNPGPGASSGSEVFLQRGQLDEYPELCDLKKNITAEALQKFITQFAGITENEHRPETGTRRPLSANISHALFMCFQKQNTIASQDQLFHRMNEDFLPQAMKDTLPYFLGAVDEEHFLLLNEYDEVAKLLRTKESMAAQALSAFEVSKTRITRLVNDAKRLGMLPQDIQPDQDDIIGQLKRLSEFKFDDPQYIPDFGETISHLQEQERSIQQDLSRLNQDIRAAKEFLSDQTEFSREASEQASRLRAIGLYKNTVQNNDVCPICESTLSNPAPSAQHINDALGAVELHLTEVHKESPHIQEHIAKIEGRILGQTERLKLVQGEMGRAIAEDEKMRAIQNQLVERARFMGRLSAFLDLAEPGSESENLNSEIASLRERLEVIRSRINSDDTAERMDAALNLIGKKMTQYSDMLDLEHSGSALRLDVRKLTVVADTENGPIPLYRMGSGENWVGYHVLTHLALHWWLRKRHRPVPGFLVFDQPTQAYYPPDIIDGGIDQIERDEDRKAVQSLFSLMRKACDDIEQPFQLIVLDHAHLRDDWFEEAIVEEWRGPRALIPEDWPSLSDRQ
jgi:DNA repair ATPase RecN